MRRFFDTLNVLLLAILVGFALWAWPRLPERIPLHFGLGGEADRWGHRTLSSWFGAPGIGVLLTLGMAWFRKVFPRHPRWVNLPNRMKLSDVPEAARGPVVEMLSGFFALLQTELLLIFGLITWGSYRAAMGSSSQAIMILVLVLAVVASPAFIIVLFLGLQRALERGKRLAERAEAMGEATGTMVAAAGKERERRRKGERKRGRGTLPLLLVAITLPSATWAQQGPAVTSPDGRIAVTLELLGGSPLPGGAGRSSGGAAVAVGVRIQRDAGIPGWNSDR